MCTTTLPSYSSFTQLITDWYFTYISYIPMYILFEWLFIVVVRVACRSPCLAPTNLPGLLSPTASSPKRSTTHPIRASSSFRRPVTRVQAFGSRRWEILFSRDFRIHNIFKSHGNPLGYHSRRPATRVQAFGCLRREIWTFYDFRNHLHYFQSHGNPVEYHGMPRRPMEEPWRAMDFHGGIEKLCRWPDILPFWNKPWLVQQVRLRMFL